MADIALLTNAPDVQPIWPEKASIVSVLAAETVANGNVGYLTSAGTYGLADANASGKEQVRGIFLQAGGAGQGVSLLTRGHVGGFDLSGLAYDALVYLSNTAGALADAAGTMTVPVGRVVPMSDADKTKVLFVDTAVLTTWS